MRNGLRIAFAGTPEFASVALDRLLASGFEVALVLTKPDSPARRGKRLQASPVKVLSLERGITVVQPRSLQLTGEFFNEASIVRDAFLAARPEVLVVAAYGLILPQWLLDLPRLGCLNIHASLLPRWRGAAPIQRAIEAGDLCTGVTIMQMNAGLDTGDMLLVESLAITANDTATSLHDKLATLGGKLIVEALELVEDGLNPHPQPSDNVSYAHKIDKAEAVIDWRAAARVIERRLRAFDPFPGSLATLCGETFKCWRGVLVPAVGTPGEVLEINNAGITVATGDGAIRLVEMQRAGGKRLVAEQFLQGRNWRSS